MPHSLTYIQLPAEVYKWPGLPLSLSGDEVMPLDYRAGHSGWLLYGSDLDKRRLSQFQRKIGAALVVVNAWCIEGYQVIRLAGNLPARARAVAERFSLDIAPLGELPYLRSPGLLVMDMDSTAIEIECIDEIAYLAGVGEEVAAITERAMRGELDFTASLRQRVAALRGVETSVLQQIKETLPLTAGLEQLVCQLHELNWKVALASGGFTWFADHLAERLQLDAIAANQLEIKEGRLTGQVEGPIVDAGYKADWLRMMAQNLQIPLTQTIAIGDGANDLQMLQTAGLGIAFHAKPKVISQAKVAIRHANLMGVMCILSSQLQYEER